MQTLVIIPVGRETVDKILVVSLLVLYNQGGDRDIKTSKNLVKGMNKRMPLILLWRMILPFKITNPRQCWNAKMAISQNHARYRKDYQHGSLKLNTKIKLDAKSYTKCITFITCEREREKSPLLNYNISIQQLITCCELVLMIKNIKIMA